MTYCLSSLRQVAFLSHLIVAMKSECGDPYKMPSPVLGPQPMGGFKELSDSEAPTGRGGFVISSLVSGRAETHS